MSLPFAVFDIGMGQIIIILVFALLFFGAKKLPELAKGLGQGIKEFKKASREMQDEIRNSANESVEAPKPVAPAPTPTPAPTETAAQPSKPQGPTTA